MPDLQDFPCPQCQAEGDDIPIDECIAHCHAAETQNTGQHEADDSTVAVSDDYHGVLAVSCRYCKQQGTFSVPSDSEIDWE